MRRLAVVLVVVACGGQPPAQTATKPAKPQPAAASCAEIGVILRGEIPTDDDAGVGRARELVIAKVCKQDRWSRSVIDCVAAEPKSTDCLAMLTNEQRARYDAALDDWAKQHGLFDDGPDGLDTPPMVLVECEDAIVDAGIFPPILDPDAPERTWNLKLRRSLLVEECEHEGWSIEAKQCISDSPDAKGVADCLADNLDATARDELTKKLTELDKTAAKIAAARKKPATIGCKQVVAAHYGDKHWKNRLDGFKAAERKRLIADSRTKMTKACTADAWDETLRACIVAGGGDSCFEASGMRLSWGYPAAGVVTSLGMPECDAYGAAVAKLHTCTKIAQDSRDALKSAFDQMQAHMASLPAAERAKLASGCKAGHDAIKSVADSVGC